MTRAGFLQRFAAWLVDNVIIWFTSVVISAIFGAPIGLTGGSDSSILNVLSGALSATLAAFLLVVQFIYYGYFWSHGGQSIGKKLLGITVVSTSGLPLPFINAGLRGTFGYWLSGLILSLGYLWALFDSKGETWHDKIFGTAVIRA